MVKTKKILIGAIYRPPNKPVEYWDLLLDNLEQAKDSGIDTIIIAGDLNCDLLQRKPKLAGILEGLNFHQMVNEPTHYEGNAPTLLDIIATPSPDFIKNTKVSAPSLSNHSDVSCLLDVKRPTYEPYKRKIYHYNDYIWAQIRQDITDFNWEHILSLPTIDEKVESWSDKLIQIMEDHTPTSIITTSKNAPPWMTKNITSLRRKHAVQHTKAKKSKKRDDWIKTKRTRDQLSEEIRTEKRNHDKKLAKQIEACNSGDLKLWFKLAKNFYNKTNNTRSEAPPLLVNGIPTSSDKEKAEKFNEYFTAQS